MGRDAEWASVMPRGRAEGASTSSRFVVSNETPRLTSILRGIDSHEASTEPLSSAPRDVGPLLLPFWPPQRRAASTHAANIFPHLHLREKQTLGPAGPRAWPSCWTRGGLARPRRPPRAAAAAVGRRRARCPLLSGFWAWPTCGEPQKRTVTRSSPLWRPSRSWSVGTRQTLPKLPRPSLWRGRA